MPYIKILLRNPIVPPMSNTPKRKPQYSIDLREKLICYIARGHTQKAAALLFDIACSTINRWWKRYEKTQTVLPKPRLGRKSKIDCKKLKSYVIDHPDTTPQLSKVTFDRISLKIMKDKVRF